MANNPAPNSIPSESPIEASKPEVKSKSGTSARSESVDYPTVKVLNRSKTSKSKYCWSVKCSVPDCFNSSELFPDLQFFRFPKDPERTRHWLKVIDREDLLHLLPLSTSRHRVCGIHFTESQCGNKRLKRGAVPAELIPTKASPPQPASKETPQASTPRSVLVPLQTPTHNTLMRVVFQPAQPPLKRGVPQLRIGTKSSAPSSQANTNGKPNHTPQTTNCPSGPSTNSQQSESQITSAESQSPQPQPKIGSTQQQPQTSGKEHPQTLATLPGWENTKRLTVYKLSNQPQSASTSSQQAPLVVVNKKEFHNKNGRVRFPRLTLEQRRFQILKIENRRLKRNLQQQKRRHKKQIASLKEQVRSLTEELETKPRTKDKKTQTTKQALKTLAEEIVKKKKGKTKTDKNPSKKPKVCKPPKGQGSQLGQGAQKKTVGQGTQKRAKSSPKSTGGPTSQDQRRQYGRQVGVGGSTPTSHAAEPGNLSLLTLLDSIFKANSSQTVVVNTVPTQNVHMQNKE